MKTDEVCATTLLHRHWCAILQLPCPQRPLCILIMLPYSPLEAVSKTNRAGAAGREAIFH
jgi:hypothetical protein